jgi:hypothetical protein
VIVMVDLVGYLNDIQLTLESIRRLTHHRTRIIVATWNWMWQPVLKAGEILRLKTPDLDMRQNWVSPTVISTMLKLAGYEPLQTLPGVLLPYNITGLSPLINTFSHAPVVERITLLRTVIARPAAHSDEREPASVLWLFPRAAKWAILHPSSCTHPIWEGIPNCSLLMVILRRHGRRFTVDESAPGARH